MTQIYGRVALIGLGLIASSMAHAMRRANVAGEIVGYARSAETREIARDLKGEITAFVAGFGTGGTLMGAARHFQEQGIGARLVAVEPGGEPRAKIDGLKHSSEAYQPPIYDRSQIDETVEVPEDHAYHSTRLLATEEGIIAGLSSGASLWAAQQLAARMDRGNIVVILGDRGERYFSTRLFD